MSSPDPQFANDVDELESRIKSHVFVKRVRIDEFFRDFDKLKHGYITETQFERALQQGGFQLPQVEVDMLVEKYDTSGKGIDYNAFCDTINSVFTLKNLEKTPRASLQDTSSLIRTRPLNKLPPRQESQLRALHLKLAKECSVRGYHLKSFFQDWDKQNTGYVTHHQFLQGLNVFNLNTNHTNLLLGKYAARDVHGKRSIGGVGGKVNYRDLHDTVEALVQGSQTAFEFGAEDSLRSSVRVRRSVASPKKKRTLYSNADQVEQLVRDTVAKSKIRLEEYFRDYDGLRLGHVAESHLGTVLETCKIHLTENQLELLKEKYRNSDGRFAYRDFTAAVNTVFQTPRITLNESLGIRTAREKDLTETRPLAKISKRDLSEANRVMRRLQDYVNNQRITLTPLFYDFDKRRTGVVTAAQFTRILQIGKIDVSPEDTDALVKKYSILDQEGLASSGMVNYAAFIKDAEAKAWVDDQSKQQKKEESKVVLRPVFVDTQATHQINENEVDYEDDDLDSLLTRIQKRCVQQRIRVAEFFRDFDRLHRGVVTFNQFRNCLDVSGITLTDDEHGMLCKAYKSTKLTGRYVDYRRFSDDVEEAFTSKGLEKSPRKEVKPMTIDLSHEKETRRVSGPVRKLLLRFRTRTNQRGIIVENFFQDIDKLRKGFVTQKQFRQGLSFLEFRTTEREMKQLIAEFKDDETGLVDYVAFAAGVYGGKQAVQDTVTFEEHSKKHLHRTRNAKQLKQKQEERDATLEEILADLKQQSKRLKVRPGEFFGDFDKLRRGTISEAKFGTSLALCQYQIKQADLDTLINEYRGQSGDVLYRRFVDDVLAA